MNFFNKCQLLVVAFILLMGATCVTAQVPDYENIVDTVQPKMVKIFGAGGLKGLESYQSGFLISADGYIMTVWSYVLDVDEVTIMLDNGEKHLGRLKGYDPRTEIALLQIDAKNLDYFNLDQSAKLRSGSKILAFSNLYGVAMGNEPSSVQFGIISATTKLSARRGAFDTNYQGPVYIVDAMTNNPGAAGGAITDRKGNIAAIIGKELRSSQNNIWLNFAIPISEVLDSVDKIRSGKIIAQADPNAKQADEPLSLRLAGLVLLPNVVANTPPFVDRVVRGTAAEKAGFRADDLIIEINGQLTVSRNSVEEKLKTIERDETVKITVQRGRKFLNLELDLNR
jgi:serine protease Do